MPFLRSRERGEENSSSGCAACPPLGRIAPMTAKSNVWLLCLVAIAPASRGPADELPSWAIAVNVSCKPEDETAFASRLPADLSREALLAGLRTRPLAASETSVEIDCGLAVRKWARHKDTFVAVEQIAVARPSGPRGYSLSGHSIFAGLFTLQGDAIQWTARTPALLPVPGGGVLSLDLAAYALTDSETAFGLRTRKTVGYAGGGAETTSLWLLRRNGARIEPVLFTPMSSSSLLAGKRHDDGTRDHEEHRSPAATITVAREKTRGFFDWIKIAGGHKARYRWNGNAYVTADEDPVDDLAGDSSP